MTGIGRFSRQASAGEHGRARELAALRMSEPLDPDDEQWLEDHLAACQPCRLVADAYESQRLALRRLPIPEPPRDLWARTAVALDAADRRRSGAPRRRLGRDTSPAMLGTVAAALVIVVVVGSTLLAGALRPGPGPIQGPSLALASAAPSPIVVQPGRVVWASHQDDGTYALNIAPVDRVCPTRGEQACAPLDTAARKLVALAFRPKAVVLAQNRPEAVVVGPGSESNGTSVFVVSLPADSVTGGTQPSPTISPASASTSPSNVATGGGGSSTATPPATSKPTPKATPTPKVTVRPTASGSATLPGSTESNAATSPETSGSQPSASSPAPSPTATIAILDNVLLAGEAASYSPDGSLFAFSARPADGSHGPDIYVWRVGEAEAHAITSDHSSLFSAWLGDRVLGSTVSAEVGVPSESASPAESAVPSASPGIAASHGPSRSPAANPTRAPSSPRSTASGPGATAKPKGSAAASGSTDGSGVPASSPENSPGASGAEGDVTLVPRSFAADPATGAQETLGEGIWRPVVDPTGTLVLYWRGTLAFDPASSSWQPAQGDLYLAPWSSIAPADLLQPSASPSESPGASGSGTGSAAASSGAAASPPSLSVPSIRPPASVAASPAATLDASLPAGSPEPASASSSESPSVSASPLAPELLAPTDVPTGLGPTTWDARWDATGTHLAIWVGDPVQPTVGRLSLLAIDQLTARADPSAALLVGTPALPGFSLAADRLAWVTPAGQDGQGSQLQVMAWQGTSAGTIESLPIPDSEQLIVAR